MKIEKLTDNKIRIILNIDDLAKKNIDVHSLIKNSDGTQKFFKKILKEAQKEVGFEVEDSKLLIEAFISTDGFFILTFTKIANEIKERTVIIPKVKRKSDNYNSNTAIYKFDSFDEFCNFCTYIKNSNLGNLKDFAKKILLYEYNYKYFLVFSDINKDFKNTSLVYVAICEFASLASTSPCFYSKLIEYGKSIFKNNAIQNGINFSESNINK
ncbi:adaptor protein MecA [bacterium]|nr:adaptor protein MecA [bacterium]